MNKKHSNAVIINFRSKLYNPFIPIDNYNISSYIHKKVYSSLTKIKKDLTKSFTKSEILDIEGSYNFEPFIAYLILQVLARIDIKYNYYEFNSILYVPREKTVSYTLHSLIDDNKFISITFEDERKHPDCLKIPKSELQIIIDSVFQFPFLFVDILKRYSKKSLESFLDLYRVRRDNVDQKNIVSLTNKKAMTAFNSILKTNNLFDNLPEEKKKLIQEICEAIKTLTTPKNIFKKPTFDKVARQITKAPSSLRDLLKPEITYHRKDRTFRDKGGNVLC